MDCFNCGAPLPPKTIRCQFCETLNDIDLRGRISVRRGTTERDCPRCGKALTAVLLGVDGHDVELDRCGAGDAFDLIDALAAVVRWFR